MFSTAEDAKDAWFDRLTMSAHPEVVEGRVLGVLGGLDVGLG